jgi:hypothetical protein
MDYDYKTDRFRILPAGETRGATVQIPSRTRQRIQLQKGSRTTERSDISSSGDEPPADIRLYYTTSEVGNHRVLDDAWVIEPNDSPGFDVYNITGW